MYSTHACWYFLTLPDSLSLQHTSILLSAGGNILQWHNGNTANSKFRFHQHGGFVSDPCSIWDADTAWLIDCVIMQFVVDFWCRGHLSGDHFTIQAKHSGKFLNAAGNTTHNGAQSLVELFSPHYCPNPVIRKTKENKKFHID